MPRATTLKASDFAINMVSNDVLQQHGYRESLASDIELDAIENRRDQELLEREVFGVY